MLNELFSRIGKSISPSGKGAVAACSFRNFAPSFPAYGTFVSEETMTAYGDVGGVSAAIGTFYRQIFADGAGGTYSEDSSVTYYSYGTELRNEGGSYEVYICSMNYNVGGYTNYWYADGNGGYWTNGQGAYSSYGTYLANCDGYNHYSDGNGSYYSESDGSGGGTSYPSYGSSTGNSGSGENQIEINGSYYNNGSYSYYEFHDGNGGYYNEYSYSYQYYGYEFTNSSWYDDTSGNTYYTQYLSDGNGGYYTYST